MNSGLKKMRILPMFNKPGVRRRPQGDKNRQNILYHSVATKTCIIYVYICRIKKVIAVLNTKIVNLNSQKWVPDSNLQHKRFEYWPNVILFF